MESMRRSRVTAVLGPTNTGKTYLAIERMLGHGSGVIGFPLRLLARENYDRAARLRGKRQVALVTGEEKIVPRGARYFFCTVESMPVDRPFDFLAVDEIQLCGDAERGHVFTDRLLHARGEAETMFLGADTIHPLLRRLVPEAEVVSRPRFSTLSYAGPRKLTRLPPRSAAIAFSAAEVYALAELLRRQSGGTAVVLGALSPRTRNAQVDLFEAGEVDYLVATDAIGMGLNLNLDHVAFTRLGKFDGRLARRLTPAEVGQIAGRAGRHMSDGTFGTNGELGGMDGELVEAVEQHRFDPLDLLYWRNRRLDFESPTRLLASLDERPPSPVLARAREGDDQLALATLTKDPEIARRAGGGAAVRLLWEVCQIPDFQKILSDQHAALLARIYRHLMDGDGRLPTDWVARQVARIDRADGDIDALMARIAHIRTWTYVTHRGDWLDDSPHWQERTRAIEDGLSDALHLRLTERFIDRRTAVLLRRLRGGEDLIGAVRANGEVLVEGEHLGRLKGFRFVVDSSAEREAVRPLEAAARRALVGEIPRRLRRLEQDPDKAFVLDDRARILWNDTAVARLEAGATALAPRVRTLAGDLLDGPQRERLRRRLDQWLRGHIGRLLGPLLRLGEAELKGPARGIAFQLAESLGTLPRREVVKQIAALRRGERRALAALGVRLGRDSVFLPALATKRATRLRALLWLVHQGRPADAESLAIAAAMPSIIAVADLADWLPEAGGPVSNGSGSRGDLVEGFCRAIGYRRMARPALAVRADALERLARQAHKLAAQGTFGASADLRKAAGCGDQELAAILPELGFDIDPAAGDLTFLLRAASRRAQRKRGPAKSARRRSGQGKDSPFSKLQDLTTAS
jgi:ATP-dependent RNA helicase SUPV3L1/SUV3